MNARKLKIILLGDAASGKSKLMERFLLDDYRPERLSTQAVNIYHYRTTVSDEAWEIEFWDTAGQEAYKRLHPSYYFNAQAAILVFDVTRKPTYKNMDLWFSELREHCPFVPVLCVANKIDLDESVTRRRFSFPEKNDLPFFFVSASTGVNVVRFFNEAIRLAIENHRHPKDRAMEALMHLIRPNTAA